MKTYSIPATAERTDYITFTVKANNIDEAIEKAMNWEYEEIDDESQYYDDFPKLIIDKNDVEEIENILLDVKE
jgi:hypothetical protein